MKQANPFPWRDFLAPRYWSTWLAVLLLRLLAFLPYRLLLFVGARLGNLFYWLAPYRREIAHTNIRLCFPQLTPNQQKQLLHDHFQSLGMMLMELALAWWGNERRLRKLVRYKNTEVLDQALTAGKGAIILGAHYTTVDISGRLFCRDYPLGVSYQPMKNRLFDEITLRSRQRIFDQVFDRHEIRATIRYIRRNHLMWVASDQDANIKDSIFVPFFGQIASTQTVPSRLAKVTGAPVIPYISRRLPNGRGYEIEVLPPLQNFPGDSVEADIERTNAVLEQLIKKAPEQYLWIHRRFKTRPVGMSGVYPPK